MRASQDGRITTQERPTMQIQVNTGSGIENKESLERWAGEHLHAALGRFGQDLTRVEVQLSDQNSGKSGAGDKRCVLEARLAGREPVAVHHDGQTQDEAFRGATQRLVHLLDHTLGKQDDRRHRDRDTIRRDTDDARAD
jgi:hypothetical protein